ncbi:transporter substrate-binding domain-containing protein [Vibrio sp. RE86]|uniref:substrate-binding periplasmic protein n=1 Tax=Vibrio sp. RE86 TaxID=2607605 RepID=UPI00149359E1|nr:transporter substrate-binding domain-containing protein [Vibrio sp. RE86]NOH79475.1 transporter substrate-binding domain-containing protein [Vibrio sp. RE86]
MFSRIHLWIFLLSSLLISSRGLAVTLQVAQTHWPPYIMSSKFGNGIAHDMVVDALTKAGYAITFNQKPWARILKETLKGKNDVIVSIWKTPEREEFYLFSKPYMLNRMAVISRKDLEFEFNDITSLKGKRVALINGYEYGSRLLEYQEMIKVDSIDLPNSLRLLLSKRADVLITDEAVGQWTMQELNLSLDRLNVSAKYFDQTPLYAAVRRDHPHAEEIIEALNDYFEHYGEAKLKELKKRYGLE